MDSSLFFGVMVLLSIAIALAVSIALSRARRAAENDLPVLLDVADRSGPHPACPACKSLSFHPVQPRGYWIFMLVLLPLAVGGGSGSRSHGVVACTVCGRRYRQG